jgi:N-acetylglucosamine malate deacetylase 1
MNERERTVIMAIGGHVGDMELTCGGVLATRALAGDRIVTVGLTPGEKGNPPGMSTGDYREQKISEARRFAERLGGEAVVFEYPDGQLPVHDEAAFRLCDVIRSYKPSVLITHWKNSIHQDHIAAHELTHRAQLYAALPGFERNEPAHFAAGPYYAENWEDPFDFVPTVYHRVSDEGFELWREAISIHWFTVHSTSFAYREYYTHLMSVRGIEARTRYAQAFDQPPMSKRRVVDSF